MAKDVFHVVPQGDQWGVKKEGNERPNSTHNTQKEAIENAQELAQDGDAIVIHRADGTIRGRFSYSEDNDKNGRSNENNDRRERSRDREKVEIQDVASVGTRVSWAAVLAGAVVAVAVYATLMALAIAIGITTREQILNMPRTYVITAAVLAVFCLLASLFLGGMVASRVTAGETKLEAIIYGLLVWGSIFVFAGVTGTNMGFNAWQTNKALDTNHAFTEEQLKNVGLTPEQKLELRNALSTKEQSSRMGLTEEQYSSLKLNEEQRNKIENELRSQAEQTDPTAVAWIGFAAMVLSILAAIAGAVVGAGPELVLREFRTRQQRFGPRVAVVPAGAAPVRSEEKVRA